MARIRTIKPEFPQSESMGNITRDARLLFIQLWTLADDSGRLRGASRMLASLLYPYDNDAPDLIDAWLEELEREECIVRYKNESQTYIQISNWLSHQKIDRPSQSKIPTFDESSRILANPRERSSGDLRIKDLRIKDQGALAKAREADKKTNQTPEAFDQFWTAYPRKVSKAQALKKYNAVIKSGIEPDTILSRLSVYSSQIKSNGTEMQFIKHPSTFLGSLDDYQVQEPKQAQLSRQPEDREIETVSVTPEWRALIARSVEATRAEAMGPKKEPKAEAIDDWL